MFSSLIFVVDSMLANGISVILILTPLSQQARAFGGSQDRYLALGHNCILKTFFKRVLSIEHYYMSVHLRAVSLHRLRIARPDI